MLFKTSDTFFFILNLPGLSRKGFFRFSLLLRESICLLALFFLPVFPCFGATPALKVQGDNNYPPYEYLENGIPKGFNVEIMQALAKEMQLPIEIELDDWNTVRRRLEKGDIDMLMGMIYSPERDLSVDFSTPHIMLTNAIFVRKNSPIHSLEDIYGKEILVQRGDIMHDFALQQELSAAILPVENPLEALRELSAGKHDAALLARLQGLQIIHDRNITNLRDIPLDILPRKYCIALSEGREDLLARINDGLRILKENGTYDTIYNRWFGLFSKPETSLREILEYLFWILLPLFLIIGMVIFWNRSLRKQVYLQTERLKKELLSRERAEESLRTLINTLPDIVCFRDGEGRWMETNDFALKLFHMENVDYRGKTGAELIAYSPSYFHTFFSCAEMDEKTWRKGIPYRDDQIIQLPEGSLFVFDVIKVPVFNPDGSRKYLVVVGRDVTERKNMENALKEKEEHYRTLVEHVPGIVFLCDVQSPWKMFYISEEVLEITGYSQEQFLGNLAWGDLILPEDLAEVEEKVGRGISDKSSYQVEYRIRHQDGSLRYVFEKARGIYAEADTPLYIEGVILDITDRRLEEERVRRINRKLEKRVRERTAQLEQANREMEIFSYSLSQDFRIPLEEIDCLSRELQKGYENSPDSPENLLLSKIRREILLLEEGIRELLQFSRITRSSRGNKRVNLSSLGEQIFEELRRKDPERSVEFSVEPEVMAFGDAGLLRIIMEKLLYNAWAFTLSRNPAAISFGTFQKDNQTVYFVKDNGKGLPMDREEKLFGFFQKLRSTPEFSESYMSLAAVQRMVHRHGGHFWGDSAPERGNTFYFTLPETGNR
ncbi:MAG TPA: transporter substrate-binding domain-containing protein [Synergistaceae bacterium]|nr:transporter substrate-binding domain-containing protein [Synergistaceae bacterium]